MTTHAARGADADDARIAPTGRGADGLVDLVAMTELQRYREPATGVVEVRSAPETAVGDVAQRTVGRPSSAPDEIGKLAADRAVGVVDPDEPIESHRSILPRRAR